MTLLFLYRRPERNPLDLNNLPDEYSRDGKQVLEDHTSSSGKLHDHTNIYIYARWNIKGTLFFSFYLPNSISQSHTTMGSLSLFTGNKVEHCRGLLLTSVVYSLTMKQCSPHFFFYSFGFVLVYVSFSPFSFFPLLLLKDKRKGKKRRSIKVVRW